MLLRQGGIGASAPRGGRAADLFSGYWRLPGPGSGRVGRLDAVGTRVSDIVGPLPRRAVVTGLPMFNEEVRTPRAERVQVPLRRWRRWRPLGVRRSSVRPRRADPTPRRSSHTQRSIGGSRSSGWRRSRPSHQVPPTRSSLRPRPRFRPPTERLLEAVDWRLPALVGRLDRGEAAQAGPDDRELLIDAQRIQPTLDDGVQGDGLTVGASPGMTCPELGLRDSRGQAKTAASVKATDIHGVP